MRKFHHSTYTSRLHLVLATLLSLGLLFITMGTASAHPAHAKVLSATPAIGSTISIAQLPSTVTVFCAENLNPDPKKSNLFVYGPSGERISQGDAKVSLSNPRQMSVAIKPNGGGIYVVQWITVSAEDNDPDQGAFGFTVRVMNTDPGLSTPPPSPFTTPVAPLWVPIIVSLLTLLLGLGIGIGIGRSRTTSSISNMRKAIAQQQTQGGKFPKNSP